MKQKKLYFLLIFLLLFWIISANEVERIISDFSNLTTTDQVAHIQNFTLKKDVANFHFLEGDLFLLSPVKGNSIAVFFTGQGTFEFKPPIEVSRERLFSEFKRYELNDSFNYLFLVFTDSILSEITGKFEFISTESKHKIKNEIKYCTEFIYDGDYFHTPIMNALLNDIPNYFYANIRSETDKDEPLFFEFDPEDLEEVTLCVRGKRRFVSDNYLRRICSFNRNSDYLLGENLSFEDKYNIVLDKYIIDSNITNRLDFSSLCEIDFHGTRNAGKWLMMYIYEKLQINSVWNENGDSLQFHKDEDNSIIWVKLQENIQPQKEYKLIIDFAGDLIKRGGNVAVIEQFDYWHPILPSKDYDHYDLTFHYPANYEIISVGKKVFEQKEKKIKTSRWITKFPVNLAPFNLGKFKDEEFVDPRIPALSIHLDRNFKNAKADVANSLAFYNNVYGKCIFDSITVAEIPRVYAGEAYPGLINFHFVDYSKLRSHEIAHQWWDCAVRPRTYHEYWLAEGLAEFSSLWFLQTSESNSEYFDHLEQMIWTVVDQHKMSRKAGKTEYPLWLGSRAPNYISYYKGAIIFHMLRNLMIDLSTFDETAFKNMMKDFYETYKNKTVSTEDFKGIVEKHLHSDMSWFFDQWIYGNQIPKLEYEYDLVEMEDGKYCAKCRITQENVNDDFRIDIPMEIDFGDNKKYRLRTTVVGTEKEFEINLPMKPKKIEFNIFNSILCE